MGCGGAKAANIAEANTIQQTNRTRKQQPVNKFGKLEDSVLKALSDIFANFAQIDPHKKKPLPKMSAIKAKEKEFNVVREDRPGTVPGGVGRIREGKAGVDEGRAGPVDPATQAAKENPEDVFAPAPPIPPMAEPGEFGPPPEDSDYESNGESNIPIEVTYNEPAPKIPSEAEQAQAKAQAELEKQEEIERLKTERQDKADAEERERLTAELAVKETAVKRQEEIAKAKIEIEQEEKELVALEGAGVLTAEEKLEPSRSQQVLSKEKAPIEFAEDAGDEDDAVTPAKQAPISEASGSAFVVAQHGSAESQKDSKTEEKPDLQETQAREEEKMETKKEEKMAPTMLDLPPTSDAPAEVIEPSPSDKAMEAIYVKQGRESPEPPRVEFFDEDFEKDLPPGINKEQLREVREQQESKTKQEAAELAAKVRKDHDATLDEKKRRQSNYEDAAANIMAKYS